MMKSWSSILVRQDRVRTLRFSTFDRAGGAVRSDRSLLPNQLSTPEAIPGGMARHFLLDFFERGKIVGRFCETPGLAPIGMASDTDALQI